MSTPVSSEDSLLRVESDPIVNALVNLTRELWITRERLFLLEHALQRQDVLAVGTLDLLEPEGRLADRLAVERKALVDGLLAALSAAPPRGNP